MSDYLTKLKTKKQATKVLPKLPKGTFGSKGSTQVGHFSKIKTDPAPPPDLSRILPEHVSEYTSLWYQAHALADFVDGGEKTAPHADRIRKLPELDQMVEKMRSIENMRKYR